MKYIFGMMIGLTLFLGFDRQKSVEENIKNSISEHLNQNGYEVKVNGIHLPLSFTFLQQKVGIEIKFKKQNKSGSFMVNVTPIGGYPIISLFDEIEYRTSISILK